MWSDANKSETSQTRADRLAQLSAAVATDNQRVSRPSGPQQSHEPDTVAEFLSSGRYARAFSSYILTGRKSSDLIPSAALQADIADRGGFLAPPAFEADLVRLIDAANPIRRLCRVLPPTTALEVQRPNRTSSRSTLAWKAEISAVPAADMTFGRFALTPHHLAGEFEIAIGVIAAGGEDAILGEIAFDGAEVQEEAFLIGTGVGQPLGIFPVAEAGIPSGRNIVAAPTAFATWTQFFASLKARYLRSPSCVVILHRSALKVLQDIAVGTAGYPLWTPPTKPGEPGRILGVPAIVSEYAPQGTGVAGAYQSGDTFAVVGDLQCYEIQDTAGMGIRRFDDSEFNRRGAVAFHYRAKLDAAPRVAEAFSRLVVA